MDPATRLALRRAWGMCPPRPPGQRPGRCLRLQVEEGGGPGHLPGHRDSLGRSPRKAGPSGACPLPGRPGQGGRRVARLLRGLRGAGRGGAEWLRPRRRQRRAGHVRPPEPGAVRRRRLHGADVLIGPRPALPCGPPAVRVGHEVSMPNAFHEGEIALQERSGERPTAIRTGAGISDTVVPAARSFLAAQRLLAAAAFDERGRAWASLLFGSPGLASTADGRRVALDRSRIARARSEPPWASLRAGAQLGLLAIDLGSRHRLRVNGFVASISDAAVLMDVAEAYPNCPKYIQRRRLDPVETGTSDTSVTSGDGPRCRPPSHHRAGGHPLRRQPPPRSRRRRLPPRGSGRLRAASRRPDPQDPRLSG